MALDTAAKRFSAMHVMCPWRTLSVLPTGTVTQAQRQGLSWLYTGILAGAPVVVTGGVVWVWVNGVATPPANQAVGNTRYWMWVNGTVYVPPQGGRPAWPRRRDEV